MAHQDVTAMLDNQTIYPSILKRFISQTVKLLRIHHHNKSLKYHELQKLITEGYIKDNTSWPLLSDILECYSIINSTLICNKTIPLPHRYNIANLYFNSPDRLKKKLDSNHDFDSFDIIDLITTFSAKLDVSTVPNSKLSLLTNTAYFDADELSPHFDTTYFLLYHDNIGYILDMIDKRIFIIDPSFSFDHKHIIQTMIYMCYFKSGLTTPSSLFIQEFKIFNVTSAFTKTHVINKVLSYFYSFFVNIDGANSLFVKETAYEYTNICNASPSMNAYLTDTDGYNDVFTPVFLNTSELKEAIKFYMSNNLI
ncbi:hypothetical protein ACO0R3_001857 [Hanseniaspora guilliermondii]